MGLCGFHIIQNRIGDKKLNQMIDFLFYYMHQAVIEATQRIGAAEMSLSTFGEPPKKRESRFSSKALTKSGNIFYKFILLYP